MSTRHYSRTRRRGRSSSSCRKKEDNEARSNLIDTLLCVTSFITVNFTSFLIHTDYACMLLVPSVVFLNRVGYLPKMLSLVLLVVPFVLLASNGNTDAFFVLGVHSLFYVLLTIHLVRDEKSGNLF